jgi:hypothetical protein
MTDTKSEKGWIFPAEIDIPEQNWYRIDFGGDSQWDIDREGHEHMADQVGYDELTSEIAAHGVSDGIIYCVVESTLVIPDGRFAGEYTAIQGADTASQQVREPDYVSGVAESRAVKRAVKRALGIRSAESEVSSDHSTTSAPDGMDSDTPASEQFDDPAGGADVEQTTDKTNDDDDSLTW